MNEVGLSLGCNVGNCISTLKHAISSLQYAGTLQKISSLYLTEPWEVRNQPPYYNCAIVLKTHMPLYAFFSFVREIERRAGRTSKGDYKPRTLDIDILFFNYTTIKTNNLTIPHARMHQRKFVLQPLAEIYPNWYHPILKKTCQDLLASLSDPYSVEIISPYPDWLYSSSING